VTFADEFEGGGLNGQWAWENPGGTSAYVVSAGRFNLVVNPLNDQWEGVNKAPRILKAQPGGSWTIETRLSSSSGHAASFGGLTVYKDAANWLSLGWLQESTLEFSGVIGGWFSWPIGVSDWYTHLRLRRVGSSYYADASPDGHNWTNVNVFVDHSGALEGARIGFMAKNWDAIGPYSLSLEYFREHNLDLMPSAIWGGVFTRKVAQMTGAGSFNRTEAFDVCGADNGIMFNWLDRTYLAFGDTRYCRPVHDGMRPNSLAFSSDTQAADGVRLDGWISDPTGAAKALFGPEWGAMTIIPTGAVGVGDRAYLFYMSVVSWDWPPGAWSCNLASVASAAAWDHNAWNPHSGQINWGPGDFNQLAVLQEHGLLYIFATPCGRFGSVKLMRVDEANVLNKAAYRYFAGFAPDGQPAWSASEASAVTVAGGPAGELSVMYNAYLRRYVMTYLDQMKQGIVLREGVTPWGPWSAPVVIAREAEYPQLYGAFMKPGYERDGGKSFYYMMSQFGPYNTFLMETTLP
jgi:hypothetical protein